MLRRLARWLGIVLLAAILLGASLTGYLVVQAHKTPSGRPEYVALGSSFAAGPGIPSRTPDSPSFCLQSDHNYAHQVARMRHLSLVDMSCGGATSDHLLNDGLLFQGPQIRAITGETQLVTVTIGGNDIAYLGNLIALGCGKGTPMALRLVGGCRRTADSTVEAGFARLARNLRAIGTAIHDRAPQAKILLVTYPSILPASGTCPRLGLPAASADSMRSIAERLEAATRDAARAMRAEVVDAATLTRGHDVCAPEPWINSARACLSCAPLHPNLAGMSAVAAEIDRILN